MAAFSVELFRENQEGEGLCPLPPPPPARLGWMEGRKGLKTVLDLKIVMETVII